MDVFVITLIAIWLYPIIALIGIWMTSNNLLLRKVIAKVLIAVSLVVILCSYFNISTSSVTADCIILSSVYLALSFVLITGSQYKKGIVKILSWIMMIIVFISGYFMGSVGILGIGLVSTEYEPQSVININDNIVYRSYGRGNATTSWGGSGITLSSHLKWLPFIEHSFFKKEYIGEGEKKMNDSTSSDHTNFSSYSFNVKYDKLKNQIILTDTSAEKNVDTLFLNKMK